MNEPSSFFRRLIGSRCAMSNAATQRAISLCAFISISTCLMVRHAHASPAQTVQTPWGVVSEPAVPGPGGVCATLRAAITPINGSVDSVDSHPSSSQPDTQRIQRAIDSCSSGQAIRLIRGDAGQTGFLSGPLKLRSGVTLWIDHGVTLYASRNPADYDNGVGTCGTATASHQPSCHSFILASDTVGSGIVGSGAIDGRGGSVLTNGPNAGARSWWDVAYQNKTEGLSQQTPLLIQIRDSRDFTLYQVAVLNAPNFHILTNGVSGITAWGIKILSPSLAYTKPGYACPANSTPRQVNAGNMLYPGDGEEHRWL